MKVSRFKALTFDCYGTLIDWETGLLTALQPWRQSHGLSVGDGELLEEFGGLETAREQESPGAPYPRILEAVFSDLCGARKIKPGAGEAAQFSASVGDWKPFPDTVEALRRLKSRFKLVVVSNVDRASFARTNEKLGIEFDAVITAEDVGCYKPDPRLFHAALKVLGGLGVEAPEVLHTAQSLYHDIAPARALGLATLWVDRRAGRAGGGATFPASVKPDFSVTSMAEVVQLLGAPVGE